MVFVGVLCESTYTGPFMHRKLCCHFESLFHLTSTNNNEFSPFHSYCSFVLATQTAPTKCRLIKHLCMTRLKRLQQWTNLFCFLDLAFSIMKTKNKPTKCTN